MPLDAVRAVLARGAGVVGFPGRFVVGVERAIAGRHAEVGVRWKTVSCAACCGDDRDGLNARGAGADDGDALAGSPRLRAASGGVVGRPGEGRRRPGMSGIWPAERQPVAMITKRAVTRFARVGL